MSNVILNLNLEKETAADLQARYSHASRLRNITSLKQLLRQIAMGVRSARLDSLVGGVKATGTLTLSEMAADHTAVIGDQTFTAKVSPSGANQFALGATDEAAAAALVAKINAHTSLSQVLVATQGSAEASEVTTITCVADVSDLLDGKYLTLYDADGSVGVWIDTDDSGTTEPAGSAALDRSIEVTGIATNDPAADVATAVASAINADSKFTATADAGVVTVTLVEPAAVTDGADVDTGFTVAVSTQGVSPIITLTCKQAGLIGNAIRLAGTGGVTASGTTLASGTNGTVRTQYFGSQNS